MADIQEILPLIREELSKYREEGMIGVSDYMTIFGCLGLVLDNKERTYKK